VSNRSDVSFIVKDDFIFNSSHPPVSVDCQPTSWLFMSYFFRIKASSRMIQAPGNKFNSINNAVSTCMSTTRTSNWSKYKFLKGHQIRTKIQPFHTTFIPTKSIVHTYIHDRKMEVTPPTLVLVYTNHNSHGDGSILY